MERSALWGKVFLATVIVVASAGGVARAGDEAQPLTVRLQIDKPYCILNFMETLRTRGYYGPTLYGHYRKSKYSEDEKLAELVQQYASVKTVYPYNFDAYPRYRYAAKNKSTSDIFFTLSARARDLAELKQMTAGIIPLADHQRLFEILQVVEPIYDDLVWKPYYDKAASRLKALQAYAEQVDLGGMLAPVARFLNSNWPADIPLVVSLSIVPGDKIRLVPPPVGNVIRAGLLTDSDDYDWYIALIAHEFTHRAFAEQPLAMHRKIDQWLTESKSPHRGTVNLMFDEVLAGAVGHKVREELSGKAHAFTYGQVAVKAMDEAAYPLVVSYLEDGKSVDHAFVDECLALHEKTFPNALHEYHSLFQVYYLLTDAEGDRARTLPRLIRKNIVGPMMYEVGSGMTDENIEALKAYEFTKVIVVTRDNERTLDYLKGKLGVLKGLETLDPGANWVLSRHDADLNPYVLVNLHAPDAFEDVTKRLKTVGRIDPEHPLLPLDG